MKYIYLIFASFFISLFSSAQGNLKYNSFLINGNVSDSIVKVYLNYVNLKGKFVKDSAGVKNHTFFFKGDVNCFFGNSTIIIKKRILGDTFKLFEYKIGLENKRISLDLRNGRFQIIGNITEKKIKNFSNNRLLILEDSISKYEEISFKNYTDSIRFVNLKKEYKKNIYKYLKKHPNSNAAAYLLFNGIELFNDDEWNSYFLILSYTQQNSYYGLFSNRILKRRELARNQKKKTIKNFGTIDSKGDSISLYNFTQSGLVLIDFWATWCNPCRASHPALVEMYKKYNKLGFQIIGVSCDALKDEWKWKQIIKEDSVGYWSHILTNPITNPKSLDRLNLLDSLQIDSFPTYILVDTNNTILYRVYDSENLKTILLNFYGE